MLFLLLALCVALFFVDLGAGSLRNWDEGIYAACSQEMHNRDSWLTLYNNGGPWINKPPVYFWMTRISFSVFGVNEFAVRFPSALLSMICVLVTFLLGQDLWEKKTGFLAATIMLCTQQYLVYSKQGQLDIPLVAFITLAIYFFRLGSRHGGFYLLSGVMSAFGCLTKQILGFFAWPVIFLYIFLRRDWKTLRHPAFLGSILLSVVLTVPWFVHQYHFFENHHAAEGNENGGKKFVDILLFSHVTDRLSKAVRTENTAWHFYFTEVLLKKDKALSLLAIAAFFVAIMAFRKKGFGLPGKEWSLILIWTVFTFLFLCLAVTKAKWYLTMFYPAFALLLARVFVQYLNDKRLNVLTLFVFTLIILTVVFSRQVYRRDFNPAIKQAGPVLKELVATGSKVILFNPPESEPALGFYSDRAVESIREMDDKLALEHLVKVLSSSSQPIIVVTRKEAWKKLNSRPELRDKFELHQEFTAREPSENLMIFKQSR